MLRFILFSLLCLGISPLASGQAFNQTPFEILEFKNDFEEQAFRQLEEGDSNLLKIIMAASGTMDSVKYQRNTEMLEEILLELDSAKLVRKSPKRIIKKVFNTVHDRLLVKYELKNQFSEVFETGFYNCVSATALYSYCLDYLGISHAIVEVPTHVYCIASIEDETWVIESTDPQQGYYEVDEDSYDEFIESLVEQKMISPEMVDDPKLDSIVNQLFPSEFISTTRLVAIQYLNQAIYDYEDKKNQQSLQNLLKANYLAPGIAFGLQNVIAEYVDKEQYNQAHFFEIVELFCKLDTSGERAQDIVSSYPYYGQKLLNGGMKLHHFIKFSDALERGVFYKDSAQQFIQVNRNLYRADYASARSQADSVYYYSQKALTYDSNSSSACRGMSLAIAYSMDNRLWTFSQAQDTLNHLFDRYTTTDTSADLRSLQLFLWVEDILAQLEDWDFSKDKSVKSDIEKVENYVLEAKTPILNPHRFGLVYSKYAHEIYKSLGKKAALELISRGLKQVPEHTVLQGLEHYYQNR